MGFLSKFGPGLVLTPTGVTIGGVSIHLPPSVIAFLERFFHKPDPQPEPTIAEVVVNVSGAEGLDANGADFDILREALKATDLLGVVSDPDADFTVFAPTDAAFIELAKTLGVEVAEGDEAGALNGILAALSSLGGGEAEGLELLKNVLLAHVSPGAKTVEELQGDVTTAFGPGVTVDGDEVIDADPDVENPEFVEGATDIAAANGIIQAIDRVILPLDIQEAMAQPTILDVVLSVSGSEGLDANGADFDILREAVIATGLDGVLADRNVDFTVFAPTDAAFVELAKTLGVDVAEGDEAGALNGILGALTALAGGEAEGVELLKNVLLAHVSPEGRTVDELQGDVTTAFGPGVTVNGDEIVDADPDVDNPEFVEGATDIEAANGVIQAIDRVILPLDIDEAIASEGVVLVGGDGRDELIGTEGADDISGGRGRDVLDGAAGDDTLDGGSGRDALRGGDGDDVLNGGRGRDHLDGGAGDDLLTGGRGRDYFDFRELSGDDVITDFGRWDKLVVSRGDFSDFHALQGAAEEVDGSLVIAGETGSITLEHFDFHDLDRHDVLFA